MATSDRPSGLTALAVIQFIFCPLEGIGCIGLIVMRLIAGNVDGDGHRPPEAVVIAGIPWLNIIALVILGALSALLLLLSGIGFLKRKRLLGRWVGNVYSVLAIGYAASTLVLLPKELTGGVTLDLIRSFFYPLFLALLLNWVFRKDLVR